MVVESCTLTLSHDDVANLLKYNPKTGNLIWLYRSNSPQWNAKFGGCRAGYQHGQGYIALGINNKLYLAHRIAWLLTHKEWPSEIIDHVNGCRHDNRLTNLRAVSHSINSRNSVQQRRNTSGVTGVSWHKKAQKWYAEVHVNKQKHYLGLFARIADAAREVQLFRSEHGFTKRHGQLS